jgi:hypothetical protein
MNMGERVTPFLLEDLTALLGKIYAKKNGTFSTYAFTYPDEFLLIASYQKKDSSPVTLKLSSDEINYQRDWDKLINFIGIFWDSHFKNSTDGYFAGWLPYGDFFYQVTRENVELSIQADKLLNR